MNAILLLQYIALSRTRRGVGAIMLLHCSHFYVPTINIVIFLVAMPRREFTYLQEWKELGVSERELREVSLSWKPFRPKKHMVVLRNCTDSTVQLTIGVQMVSLLARELDIYNLEREVAEQQVKVTRPSDGSSWNFFAEAGRLYNLNWNSAAQVHS